MCIDCSHSMHGILDIVKTNALKLYPDLKAACSNVSKNISQLRVKIIGFRNFNIDKENGMFETKFFYLPEEERDFDRYISNVVADGGGDEPKNGLEALALAIKSDWTSGGDRRRHIIIMCTDDAAYPLEASSIKNEFYPDNIPKDFDELFDLWEDSNLRGKTLHLYAPDSYPWSEICCSFSHSLHHPTKRGEGLKDCDYETILRSLVCSI